MRHQTKPTFIHNINWVLYIIIIIYILKIKYTYLHNKITIQVSYIGKYSFNFIAYIILEAHIIYQNKVYQYFVASLYF